MKMSKSKWENVVEKQVKALALKLTFKPVSGTPYRFGADFNRVAYNDEFVLFYNGSWIQWISKNGHYSGSFLFG